MPAVLAPRALAVRMGLVQVKQAHALEFAQQDTIAGTERPPPRPQINRARWDIIVRLAREQDALLEKRLPMAAVVDSFTIADF